MRRIALLALLLVIALAGSAQAKPLLGIADQKASTFDDPRLQALKLRHARLYIPWDTLSDKNTRPEVDAWMAGAKRDRITPLLTIARSRREGRKAVRPTPKQLTTEVLKWRKRWPGQVKTLSTWNEANLSETPERVAKWWLALSKACPSCTVLGADLLDDPKVLAWSKRFVKAAKRPPKVWALHSYNDANTFSTKITKALLKGLKGDIWLTETGGVAHRPNPRYTFPACGVAHQTKATKYLLEKVAVLSPRIKRVYIFHWGLGTGPVTFDAALIDARGRERPALNVLRKYQGLKAVRKPVGGISPEYKSCKRGPGKAKPPKKPRPPA